MTHTAPSHHRGSTSHSAGGHMEHPRIYDLLGHAFFAGTRPRVFRTLASASGTRPGDRVLDVGCGTGHLTRAGAKAAGPHGSAVGIDPAPDAIARARRATRSRNCQFAEGRAEALDFPDGSFDVVVTSLMLHHLPEDSRPQAIAEMRRVLRPEGRLLVADFRPPTNPLLRRVVHPVVSAAMEHNPVDLIESMMRTAGFENVAVGAVRPWIHYVTGKKSAAR